MSTLISTYPESEETVPVAFPKATALPIPAVTNTTSRKAFCQIVIAKVDSSGGVTVGGKCSGNRWQNSVFTYKERSSDYYLLRRSKEEIWLYFGIKNRRVGGLEGRSV